MPAKRLYSVLVIFMSVLITITECISVIKFNSLINDSLLRLILGTDMLEASEFISMYLGWQICLFFSLIIIICLILFYGISKKQSDIQCRLQNNGYLNSILCVILFLGLGLSAYRFTQSQTFFKSITPIHRFCIASNAAVNSFIYQRKAEQFRETHVPELTKNDSSIKNIIIVIGESSSKYHMGLYGYELPTTPCLNKLYENKHLIPFKDVISSSTQTFVSINRMFSFADRNTPIINSVWYEKGLLPDIMKAAGYKTYWISNQEAPLLNDDICDYVYCRKDALASEITSGLYDERLLEVIDSSINKNDRKRFVVIHFWGSHFIYKLRYPKNCAIFNASDEKEGWTIEQKQLISEYDNSIRYTDSILCSIIERFKNEESILLYVSDHGEEVYNFRNFAGRSPDKINRYMLDIPMLFYMSDKFMMNYPQKKVAIETSFARPYETDNLIHTILDLADIKTVSFDSTKSIINPLFSLKQKRIVNDCDYDSNFKNSNYTL
nr:phosphoethanolamine transferase [Parabacteroides goldsteinii]